MTPIPLRLAPFACQRTGSSWTADVITENLDGAVAAHDHYKHTHPNEVDLDGYDKVLVVSRHPHPWLASIVRWSQAQEPIEDDKLRSLILQRYQHYHSWLDVLDEHGGVHVRWEDLARDAEENPEQPEELVRVARRIGVKDPEPPVGLLDDRRREVPDGVAYEEDVGGVGPQTRRYYLTGRFYDALPMRHFHVLNRHLRKALGTDLLDRLGYTLCDPEEARDGDVFRHLLDGEPFL